MDLSFFLGIGLISLVLQATKTTAVCEPKRKEFGLVFTNKTLVARLLASPAFLEEIHCQLGCHANDFCDAYNINTETNQCELLDGRLPYSKFESRANWTFRAQKCESTCANGGTCFHFNGKSNCACPRGWAGDLCDDSSTTTATPVPSQGFEVLSFPGESTGDLILIENPFPLTKIYELTVSMKLQLDRSTSRKLTPISYFEKDGSQVVGRFYSGFRPGETAIGINNDTKSFESSHHVINDANWHHVLFTWKVDNGLLELYIDGAKRGDGTVSTASSIYPLGTLVIGQDQDSHQGGYSVEEAMRGNLTSFNIWNRVLNASEISDLASKCATTEGNIVHWSQVVNTSRQGNVQLFKTPCNLL